MPSESEHQKILNMLEAGVISVEDALKLLGALNNEEPPTEFQIQEIDSNSQEGVFCIPGGKCYTLDELKKLKKPTLPKFNLNGESGNAES